MDKYVAQLIIDELIDYLFNNCKEHMSSYKQKKILFHINEQYESHLHMNRESLDYSYVLEKIQYNSIKDIRKFNNTIRQLREFNNISYRYSSVNLFITRIIKQLDYAEKKKIRMLNSSFCNENSVGMLSHIDSKKNIENLTSTKYFVRFFCVLCIITLCIMALCMIAIAKILFKFSPEQQSVIQSLPSMSIAFFIFLVFLVLIIIWVAINTYIFSKMNIQKKTDLFKVACATSLSISLFSFTFNLFPIESLFKLSMESGNNASDNTTDSCICTSMSTCTPTATPPPGEPNATLNYDDHYAYIIGYPEGDVRPENYITRAEATTIFFRLLTDDSRNEYWSNSSGYGDVNKNAWYNNAISTMSNAGIVSGYIDGSFAPNALITRAELATIAARFNNESYDEEDRFTDIDGNWAKKYINREAAHGRIKGYEDGTFKPNQYITRAEAMTLINNLLNRKPYDIAALHDDMVRWTDNNDTDSWYYLAVQEATNSHYYSKSEDDNYEIWTDMRDVRDWTALEQTNSTATSAGKQ